jgi:hypothetical protein
MIKKRICSVVMSVGLEEMVAAIPPFLPSVELLILWSDLGSDGNVQEK